MVAQGLRRSTNPFVRGRFRKALLDKERLCKKRPLLMRSRRCWFPRLCSLEWVSWPKCGDKGGAVQVLFGKGVPSSQHSLGFCRAEPISSKGAQWSLPVITIWPSLSLVGCRGQCQGMEQRDCERRRRSCLGIKHSPWFCVKGGLCDRRFSAQLVKDYGIPFISE